MCPVANTPPEPPMDPPSGDGFSDETLMMFADGVLDDATTEAVVRALEADPQLAERLEAFMLTRDGLRGAFADVLTEKPPQRLVDAIMAPVAPRAAPQVAPSAPQAPESSAGNVTPFRPRGPSAPSRPRFAGGFVPMAMAAGVAAVVAGLGGLLAGRQIAPSPNAVVALAASEGRGLAGLAGVRDGQAVDLGGGLSGQATGTYRLADRRICRTVTAQHAPTGTGAEGVICASERGWRIEMAQPRGEGASSFRPASGQGPIDALLEAGGAQTALTPAEVDALIRSQWR
jgi:hypothetical protein